MSQERLYSVAKSEQQAQQQQKQFWDRDADKAESKGASNPEQALQVWRKSNNPDTRKRGNSDKRHCHARRVISGRTANGLARHAV
jgi:hypothetical protein